MFSKERKSYGWVNNDIKLNHDIQEHTEKAASTIPDKIHQNNFQSKFWHNSHKTRHCQILRWKTNYQSTYLSGLNLWTKAHSVFCHVVYILNYRTCNFLTRSTCNLTPNNKTAVTNSLATGPRAKHIYHNKNSITLAGH